MPIHNITYSIGNFKYNQKKQVNSILSIIFNRNIKRIHHAINPDIVFVGINLITLQFIIQWKERSIKNKKYMIEAHVVPYFENKPMNSITPSDIIQWQNTMREKGFSQTYLRMIQNQITALFTHTGNIYNLANNPCKKVKKMGKADADKIDFWTRAEYDKFIETSGLAG